MSSQNITLSLPEEDLREARILAARPVRWLAGLAGGDPRRGTSARSPRLVGSCWT